MQWPNFRANVSIGDHIQREIEKSFGNRWQIFPSRFPSDIFSFCYRPHQRKLSRLHVGNLIAFKNTAAFINTSQCFSYLIRLVGSVSSRNRHAHLTWIRCQPITSQREFLFSIFWCVVEKKSPKYLKFDSVTITLPLASSSPVFFREQFDVIVQTSPKNTGYRFICSFFFFSIPFKLSYVFPRCV